MISISGSSGTTVHVSLPAVDPWIREAAAEIAKRAPRELEALVAVSSPSGDVHGANECTSVCVALAPGEATIERVPCSSPDHAEDLIARIHGTGTKKILLVGHVDTVVAHAQHRPLERVGEQLVGSGTRRHEGRRRARDRRAAGVRHAPGALRARSRCCSCATRSGGPPTSRTSQRFAGFDACLCFEAGELARRGRGRGRAPQGRRHDPRHRHGPQRPLGLRAGPRAATRCWRSPPPRRPSPPRTIRRVPPTSPPSRPSCAPATRSTSSRHRRAVLRRARRRPRRDRGACSTTSRPRSAARRCDAELIRRWPGMQSEIATAPVLARGERAARPPHRRRPPAAAPATRATSRPTIPITDRRPRPARRQGPQPRGVRPRGVAAAPRRGRAGGDPGGARR